MRELPLLSSMSEATMREIDEKLSEPNEFIDDLRGFYVWNRWQKRSVFRRAWDRLLRRKPPPEPPPVRFVLRTELPPASFGFRPEWPTITWRNDDA